MTQYSEVPNISCTAVSTGYPAFAGMTGVYVRPYATSGLHKLVQNISNSLTFRKPSWATNEQTSVQECP